MKLLGETHIDFMKYRRFWVGLSLAVMALGAVSVFFLGRLNMGIDFAGGTQLTLKFAAAPDVQELRQLVGTAGVGEAQIQRFGEAAANEVMIRTPILVGSEEGSGAKVREALDRGLNAGATGMDLNQSGSVSLAEHLAAADPDGVAGPRETVTAHYGGVAESVMKVRKDRGIFQSWSELAGVPGLSAKALAHLQTTTRLGKFAVLASENVGPQVGSELRQRGFLAVIGALLGMLVYIWLRFELRFGVGATMASLHDVLITLGLYSFMGYEFNLTTIAAFLTLIGYSVNDTVVTFDRVRENMRRARGRAMLELLNASLNQMLSRTLLTGGTTVLAALMLFLFGGEAIRGFAFIIGVGIIVGTYSSIYIASPFALYWETWFGAARKAGTKPTSPTKTTTPAKPARAGR